MKIAVAQIACSLGDVSANLQKVREFSARAAGGGAGAVLFPEMVDTGYAMPVIREQATSWREGAVPELQAIARSFALTIVCGVSEREGASIFNTQVWIDATGEIKAKYRKSHLFGAAPIEEHKCFSPGGELVCVPLDEFRAGLSICYDLRFPEVYRRLACRDDVNAFFTSSAWPFPRVEHFRILAQARAIENQSYVLAANRVGTDAGVTFCGNSAVIDPYGVTIAGASADREELLYAELSPVVLEAVRERMPIFEDRRPDLY